MKVILSRKGMDSASGGIANPILPDGSLLALPIPDKTSGKSYKDFFYKGQSLYEIIRELKPKFDFNKNATCHLDPDICNDIKGSPENRKPAFGQQGISAAHLDKMEVNVGDIFLFYGMFRETNRSDGTLRYVRNAPVIHLIYGYMKIAEILRDESEMKSSYPWHPHCVNCNRPNNRLYLPESYGTFQYNDSLMLTKKGQDSRRLWALPAFFADKNISVSWHGNNNQPVLKNEYAELNSSCRGQEFVVTAFTTEMEETLSNWVNSLICDNMSKKGT